MPIPRPPGSLVPVQTRGVLVTGGSSGIGRATVRRFALGGDRVWFTYRSGGGRAADLVAELNAAGAKAEAFPFDQSDWAAHQPLLDRLPGPVDVLVNNAAVGSATVRAQARGDQDGGDQDEAMLRINSLGPLWLIRHVLPGMLQRGHGTIVNIASVGGGVAVFPEFHVADGMSNAALAYLTRHLAAQLTHEPVDVVGLCPGAVDTPMLHASTLDRLPPGELARLTARLPRGRLTRPEEIADLVHWLATGGAPLLHGAVLDAAAGLGVHPGLVTGLVG
jgi:NAD(P)-dependent dehydrogenase (short-subunit alcohol dehydrogenase family)